MTEVFRLDWLTDADVFAVRQRGREVAAAVGLDGQDQIRLATALSEVGREVLSGDPASAVFRLLDLPARLVVEISAPRRPAEETPGSDTGMAPARRLLDSLTVTVRDGRTLITLEKNLPEPAGLGGAELTALRALLRGGERSSPVEELRVQNADLVHTLDQLRARQQDLVRLNEELEETNRGVMAMYKQLTDELEETNRGVVALYAELDDKGRQLLEANDAKTRFLRNVSHELRAPVSSILGLSGLLMDSQLNDEQRRQVTYLQASARSLRDIVNELLDLARAESHALPLSPAPVALGPLLAELAGTLRPLATERRVDLVVEPPEVPVVHTDAGLLTRVLRNLLTNALSFTETGDVRLRVRPRPGAEAGEQVEISVADTGIGIPEEHHEHVFEEFFQVPGPLQVSRAGTGLGLPYARRVTEALGGTLTLTSRPGAGSTFTVTLPVGAAVPDAPAAPEPHPPLGHVLVADDDPAFREVVRAMLEGTAARVTEAADGAEALAAIAAARPDVVLLDLRMPNLDGAGALALLRADPDPRVRDLPVILMTSVDIDAEVRRAAEPAAALLAKADMDRAGLLRLIAASMQVRP
jgi:signal transduction histidine kinase